MPKQVECLICGKPMKDKSTDENGMLVRLNICKSCESQRTTASSGGCVPSMTRDKPKKIEGKDGTLIWQ